MNAQEELRRRYSQAEDFRIQTQGGLELARIKQKDEEYTIYFSEEVTEKIFALVPLYVNHLHHGASLKKLTDVAFALGVVSEHGKVKEVLASPVLAALMTRMDSALRLGQHCADQLMGYLP